MTTTTGAPHADPLLQAALADVLRAVHGAAADGADDGDGADGARLRYASLLRERGADESQRARGRFIEVQVKLAQKIDPGARPALIVEEQALLKQHKAAWSAPALALTGKYGGWRFARGFIDLLRVWHANAIEDVLDGLPAFMAREPLRWLRLQPAGPAVVDKLLAHGAVGKLRTLQLTGPIGGTAIRKLAASAQLASLRTLDLMHSGGDDGDCAALLASPHLRARAVALGGNRFGTQAVAAIVERKPPLRKLYAPVGDVDDAAFAALLASDIARELRALGMRGHWIGDAGARLLLRPTVLPHIQSLDLDGNSISADVGELLRARFGHRLHLGRDVTKPLRRGAEALVDVVGAGPVLSGTERYVAEWAAAVAAARYAGRAGGVDVFLMEGWARPEGAPCARCRTVRGQPALGVDGQHVSDCPSCRGGGVTLGPPRPWSDVDGAGDALTRLLAKLGSAGVDDIATRAAGGVGAVDMLLDPQECATAADLLSEAAERIVDDDGWRDATEFAVDGLRAAWAAGAKLRRRRRR